MDFFYPATGLQEILSWVFLWTAGLVLFAVVCSLFGRYLARHHFVQIRARETAVEGLETSSLRSHRDSSAVRSAVLITGSAVVTVDYLQKVIALFVMLIGGRIRAYERLLRRARAEAFVRMREEAVSHGADCVINVRFETSTVSLLSNPGCIEVLSYGTALVFESKSNRPYNFLRKGTE